MKKDLYYLFQKNDYSEDNKSELLNVVTKRIEKEISKKSHNQKTTISIFYFSAIIATIASGLNTISGIFYSNFSSYFSLIFSDTKIVMSGWYEFFLSLFGSLPLLGISIFIASICLLIISSRKYANRPRITNLVTI